MMTGRSHDINQVVTFASYWLAAYAGGNAYINETPGDRFLSDLNVDDVGCTVILTNFHRSLIFILVFLFSSILQYGLPIL